MSHCSVLPHGVGTHPLVLEEPVGVVVPVVDLEKIAIVANRVVEKVTQPLPPTETTWAGRPASAIIFSRDLLILSCKVPIRS